MELLHLFFLTVSLALLLPFLVAKFLSIAFPGDASPPNSLAKSSSIVRERIVMEDIRSSRNRLTVPASESVTKNVHEFLDEAPPAKVAEFEGLQVPAEEIVEITHQGHELPEKLPECGLQEEYDVDKFPESVGFPDKLSEENIEDSAIVKEILENRVGFESAANIEVVAASEEINQVEECGVKETNEEKEVERFDSDEDDWEGIERTDLEKAFAAAATFVLESSTGDNEDPLATAGVGTDLRMELYGLHKIATEGPCCDPQPMALKLSARAKNAWQKLGRMSPEVAMEQYIKILSDKVPTWMEGKFADGIRPEPSEAGISTVAFDLSTFSVYQTDSDERKPEQKTGAEGGCSSGAPNSDYRAKE